MTHPLENHEIHDYGLTLDAALLIAQTLHVALRAEDGKLVMWHPGVVVPRDVRQNYQNYLQQEEINERQRVYDEDAIKVARTLIRGLQLLLTHGTNEEKDTVRKVFHNK